MRNLSRRFACIFPGTGKPLIALCHLPPLPGTLGYDAEQGIAGILAAARRDLDTLLAQPEIDGILLCNTGDRPYSLRADLAGVAALARVIGALAPRDRPFGIEFRCDARAALAVAVATGAAFIRAVAGGLYASDMGLWSSDTAALLRQRHALHADDVAIFMDLTPLFAAPLGTRALAERARSLARSSLPDAMLVSGPAGDVRMVKEAIGADVPVLAGGGSTAGSLAAYLRVADGAIVDPAPEDGNPAQPIDEERLRLLVAEKRNGLAGEWPG